MKTSHKVLLIILVLIGIVLVFGQLDDSLYNTNYYLTLVLGWLLRAFGIVCLFVSYRIYSPYLGKSEDKDVEF